MSVIEYDPKATLREARQRYFAENHLGDGGYEDKWVRLRAFGVPIGSFPNSPQHVRSVRLHDLHHVLTGYDTSWKGEAEIGLWELASGCADHPAAWVLNFVVALIGIIIAPARSWRAVRRGRKSRNLYSGEFSESLLDRRVSDLRRELHIQPDRHLENRVNGESA